MRSFRFQLAARFTFATALSVGAVFVVSTFALRAILDRELDSSILSVASIQAASVTDAPSGSMHFHEWEVTPTEASSLRDLIRYAQVWGEGGRSLLRSRYMTADLPVDPQMLETVARDGELVWSELQFQGTPVRSLYYPLSRHGDAHRTHVLQVAAPLLSRNEMVARLSYVFTAIWVLVCAASFGGSWWLAGRTVKPVYDITAQAEEIGGGSLDRRIDAWADTREYRRLVDVLNTMLGRIQDAFEAQRRFTADASHELRSPLTAMRGGIELALRRERDAAEYRRMLASNLDDVGRLQRIAEDLLTLARSDAGALSLHVEEAEPAEIVTHVLDRLRPQAEAKKVGWELRVIGLGAARLDPDLFGRIVWNLAENALKFSPAGGVVSIALETSAESLRLEVTDEGPGFEHPSRIFDRFYREDASRTRETQTSGSGLGLSIVKAIAELHGGHVTAENRTYGGARVTVQLAIVGIDRATSVVKPGAATEG